jgi:hypothetical protein
LVVRLAFLDWEAPDRSRGHGAVSDTPVEQRLWIVCEWRNRKAVWWQTFRSEAEALEAVGLRE